NRVTGAPIWPIEERPVPQTPMPDDTAWPTQPFPTKPPPFARQSMTADDVNPYLPANMRDEAKQRIANAVNGGLFTPPSMKETVEIPGNRGGSNWGTTASDPAKGIMYVVSIDAPSLLKLSTVEPTNPGIGAV